MLGRLAALLLLALSLNASADDSIAALMDKYSPLVASVETSYGADLPPSSTGSGFVVSAKGLVATNFHVVSDSLYSKRKIFVRVAGATAKAEVVAVDIKNDVALLKTDVTYKNQWELTTAVPKLGDELYVIGYPGDLGITISPGIYQKKIFEKSASGYHLAASVGRGMSGGPVLDRKGRVVGVIAMILDENLQASFAVPVEHVVKLMNSKLAEKQSDILESIKKDILDQQETQLASLLATLEKRTPFGAYAVPGVKDGDNDLKCSEIDKDADWKTGDYAYRACHLDRVGADDEGRTGSAYSFAFIALKEKVHPLKLRNKISRRVESLPGLQMYRDGEFHSRFICRSNVQFKREGQSFSGSMCVRSRTDFRELMDAEIKIVKIGDEPLPMGGNLVLQNFTRANVETAIDKFVSSIRVGNK